MRGHHAGGAARVTDVRPPEICKAGAALANPAKTGEIWGQISSRYFRTRRGKSNYPDFFAGKLTRRNAGSGGGGGWK